jgi:CheY-like chemotaxis protein
MTSVYKQLLLVEDNPADKDLFLLAVERFDSGISCETAYSGSNALQMLQTSYPLPELIFLDLNMPRMDGFEFLTLVKKDPRLKEIPVVILTTSASDADQCYKLGAGLFLTKPNSLDDFRTMISDVLSGTVKLAAKLVV